ncbi:Peptidase S58 DmpA OS=Tsukamurella paurometabola (strain ATCC 8368 / DSM / CCUG 35730 / CIP 100753 / JCM 10117 / KCTC 9821 / NBRC 16120 / NCIMB 702349 /NCTC 13040) OX=521096 GN=Tpau_0198 PE=3 SV=1 [Tsukamurella paurometabola]|uniref:Peptidase S58 DmpA n=1 Tax=Tsukamurella paurometabola (strain ATCC 8368 / DSM 20162 / CCUG 35730 / CIP 100753 / JCM 10117 / KCTC 9821 / NBRC 16120 / NCIMB 702349 / NCTC 13040) TaxID=521096 RepID=D5UQL9_TSUPD|nr:P1 family peptidase [Tsukamurella paurometabola]ADG76852.1 peptidase S58 DmpA [Tsukamurella paurometabola DSM 20162]SUP41918.1 L-aminopeptidase/D-esterase [Tsukamurella paurometabola]
MPASLVVTIPGVRIGHHTDAAARTGCTVVILPDGTVGSGEVRGGAPASREFDLLSPERSVGEIHAAVLTGGSAFGLACADGVMRRLEEEGRGVQTVAGRVPIVPTLGLFDLMVGDSAVRPTAENGYTAAASAAHDAEVNGLIGAGTGATVGKSRGIDGIRDAGLAYAEARSGALIVGALCAVNAFGDVLTGAAADPGLGDYAPFATPGERENTTIGVVLTNARLTKSECLILAQGAHDGLARAIDPPHTRFDGDAFISAATGQVDAKIDLVRALAIGAVTEAIRSRA